MCPIPDEETLRADVLTTQMNLDAARDLLASDDITHHEAQMIYHAARKRYATALGRFSALVVGARRQR
jgi:hypothetical protein